MASDGRAEFDPSEIARVDFPTAFRGYDQDAVRRYLTRLAAAVSRAQELGLLGTVDPGQDDARVMELELEAERLRSRAGELERELGAATGRVQSLEREVQEAARAATLASAAPGPLDEAELISKLGQETARVLETARSAAADLVQRAENDAASIRHHADAEARATIDEAQSTLASARAEASQIVSDAEAEAAKLEADTRAEVARAQEEARMTAEHLVAQANAQADRELSDARAEAQRVRSTADAEAESRLEAARAEAEQRVSDARAEAEQRLSAARLEADDHLAATRAQADRELTEARTEADRERTTASATAAKLVGEAEEMRNEILGDLVVRRRMSREQLVVMNAARDRLAVALASARNELDDVASVLQRATPVAEELDLRDVSAAGMAAGVSMAPVEGVEPVAKHELDRAQRAEVSELVALLDRRGGGSPGGSGANGGSSSAGATVGSGTVGTTTGTSRPADGGPQHGVAAFAGTASETAPITIVPPGPDPIAFRNGGGAPGPAGTGTAAGTLNGAGVKGVGLNGTATNGAGPATNGSFNGPGGGNGNGSPAGYGNGSANGAGNGVLDLAPGDVMGSLHSDATIEMRAGEALPMEYLTLDQLNALPVDEQRNPYQRSGGSTRFGSLSPAVPGQGLGAAPGSLHRTATRGDLPRNVPYAGTLPAAFEGRDIALTRATPGFRRRLKRAVNDDQSEVLERLRAGRGPVAPAELPPFDQQLDAYIEALRPVLFDVVTSGAEILGCLDIPVPEIESLCLQLARHIVDCVRTPAVTAIERAATTDREAILDPIRAIYRDFRNGTLPDLIEDALHEAFALGLYHAIEPTDHVLWITDPRLDPDPICEDNSASKALLKGTNFPSGHPRPLSMPGCRCLLIPAG